MERRRRTTIMRSSRSAERVQREVCVGPVSGGSCRLVILCASSALGALEGVLYDWFIVSVSATVSIVLISH